MKALLRMMSLVVFCLASVGSLEAQSSRAAVKAGLVKMPDVFAADVVESTPLFHRAAGPPANASCRSAGSGQSL